MSGALVRRLHKKLDAAGFATMTLKDAKAIERAFVEALKEEVEKRYEDRGQPPPSKHEDPTYWRPLAIPGLGSFKMRTRPGKVFENPNERREYAKTGNPYPTPVTKPPARRLVFSSKWEPLRGWKFDGVVEGKTLKLTMTKEPTP